MNFFKSKAENPEIPTYISDTEFSTKDLKLIITDDGFLEIQQKKCLSRFLLKHVDTVALYEFFEENGEYSATTIQVIVKGIEALLLYIYDKVDARDLQSWILEKIV